ncbi:MAG: CoA-acylating methylmalonate-semialdehyde dehydrogenase [Gammaproteobacteria bacterium]|jgi:malonate-semialdehyde dehydrogenase (acetylating)/methylmalonate-semialdehyde dehydrogenase|nr:CoA-acylating methylmalonate-semialdehyde dehydrogenase [Gammaproteobacteria bacterium]
MIPHWINGQRVLVAAGRHAEVFNPATGVATGRVPLASAAEAQAAVAVALAAWPAWRDTPALRRARVLFRFRELVERHREELARLITAEHGKTLGDAAGSIQRGLEVIEFACGIPQLLQGEASREVGTGIDCQSLREPLGVCAGITPFNFPAMVPLWMFPVAIACGNSFVLKPSERTPSCAVRLAELMGEAGLPPGVLNVLHGDREAVDELLCHPDVAAVSFVGSTPVARHVYAGCAQAGKRVQALGGAKNHLLVMPDADMAQAADALVAAAYGSAGERCMAISVAVAVGSAGDALRAALLPRIRALRLGPGTQADVDVGPLITAQHLERVRGYIAAGEAEGAELVVDGRIAAERQAALSGGYFLGPTLFDHASSAMRIWREEIFGPLLIIVRVATPADALALVNQHEFANGAAIYTRDGRLARECAARLDVGMVGINVPIPVPAAFFSFGGRRSSFFGDSNVHGVEGVRFYTQIKTITSRWPHGGDARDSKLDMPTL